MSCAYLKYVKVKVCHTGFVVFVFCKVTVFRGIVYSAKYPLVGSI